MKTVLLTREQLQNSSIDLFERWYNKIKGNLKFIQKHLVEDLQGYAKQTGANLLAFFQVRVKSKESFLDKIDAIRNDEKSLDTVFGTESTIPMQSIVNDLIGARLVMYFFNDLVQAVNYFATYPTFKIERTKWYLLEFPKTPMTSRDKQNLENRLKQLDKNFKIEKKDTGYESLHLLVRYQEPYASFRTFSHKRSIKKWNGSIAPHSKLTNFPIEIQIRTILQHTWAQIEHRMNYNIKKSPAEETINDRQFLEDFQCQKALLYAVEYHQRIIYDRFLDLRRNPLALSKTGSVEIWTIDLRDFSESEQNHISNINALLDSDPSAAIDQLNMFAADIKKVYQLDVLNLSYELEIEKWSRKRLVLAIIAYLLQNSNQYVCHKLREVLYPKALVDIDEISVHEFIRNVDSYFRWNENLTRDKYDKIMVSDPVISYRAAGSFIKYGDFRRGIYLLSEAINEGYLDAYPKVKGAESILTKMHFHRRIGEYYFFAYINDGYTNLHDLVEACKSMESAYRSNDKFPSKEANLQERSKVLANLIVMYFCRYIKPDFPNPQAFYNKIEELDHDIKLLLETNDILSKQRVHAMEALSLYLYFCKRIDDARDLISKCRQVLDQKIKSDNVKNPLHLKMTDIIYTFINSNWHSENRVSSRLIEEPAEVR